MLEPMATWTSRSLSSSSAGDHPPLCSPAHLAADQASSSSSRSSPASSTGRPTRGAWGSMISCPRRRAAPGRLSIPPRVRLPRHAPGPAGGDYCLTRLAGPARTAGRRPLRHDSRTRRPSSDHRHGQRPAVMARHRAARGDGRSPLLAARVVRLRRVRSWAAGEGSVRLSAHLSAVFVALSACCSPCTAHGRSSPASCFGSGPHHECPSVCHAAVPQL